MKVQNKDNRTCKGFEGTFDTRKAFIEHCQLVHGMKFKAKGARASLLHRSLKYRTGGQNPPHLPNPATKRKRPNGPDPRTYRRAT